MHTHTKLRSPTKLPIAKMVGRTYIENIENIFAQRPTEAENNRNDRFELFILDPGEAKIETKEETSTFRYLPAPHASFY